MNSYALILFIFLGGCASNWTATDTKYEIAFQSVNLADAYTTSRIRHMPDIHESNSLTQAMIGSQPKEADIALLFITYGITHYIIARVLPGKWRRFYQVGTTIRSTSLVIGNCKNDLCQ